MESNRRQVGDSAANGGQDRHRQSSMTGTQWRPAVVQEASSSKSAFVDVRCAARKPGIEYLTFANVTSQNKGVAPIPGSHDGQGWLIKRFLLESQGGPSDDDSLAGGRLRCQRIGFGVEAAERFSGEYDLIAPRWAGRQLRDGRPPLTPTEVVLAVVGQVAQSPMGVRVRRPTVESTDFPGSICNMPTRSLAAVRALTCEA